MTDRRAEVLVVGGGLSGLHLLGGLLADGVDAHLLEARDRLGGRILGHGPFDLGPAWFWPGQPRMAALVADLGLRRVRQHDEGHALVDGPDGGPRRLAGPLTPTSHRVVGGFSALIDALAARLDTARLDAAGLDAARLDAARVHRRCPVARVTAEEVTTAHGDRWRAKTVVLAVPPRLVPALAPEVEGIGALGAVPTWMGGSAKLLLVYPRPFWREAGLSGDAFSRAGPMVEVHDASTPDGPAALFGFLGGSASAREQVGEGRLREAALAQAVRLFGAEAGAPTDCVMMDWGRERFTATAADDVPLTDHPTYGRTPWRFADGRILVGGTETDAAFGGYLEGALAASERVRRHLRGCP